MLADPLSHSSILCYLRSSMVVVSWNGIENLKKYGAYRFASTLRIHLWSSIRCPLQVIYFADMVNLCMHAQDTICRFKTHPLDWTSIGWWGNQYWSKSLQIRQSTITLVTWWETSDSYCDDLFNHESWNYHLLWTDKSASHNTSMRPCGALAASEALRGSTVQFGEVEWDCKRDLTPFQERTQVIKIKSKHFWPRHCINIFSQYYMTKTLYITSWKMQFE